MVSNVWVPIIVDHGKQKELLESAHVNDGGHCGINRSRKILTARCFWEGMSEDVVDYISKCDRCQKSRINKLQKGSEDLHPIPVPRKVWSQVGIDIMMMKKVGEYRYLIRGMDYFSKNLEMRTLKTKSAREVAQFIYEDIICRWGSPDVIITDQGREFCNAINDELMERAHCKHRITSSYHPQSNGLVERQNRTTTNFLLKNMDCQDDWVDMIPTMTGSHRHTVHCTTNIEPSAILLGRKPTLATDMMLRSEDYFNRELQDEEIEEMDNGNYTEILKQLNFVRQSVFNTTSQNISTAQVSQKKYYDIRHLRNFKFAKNDIVIKFLPRNSERKGGKLEDKFSGPYVIDEITDLGIARLRTFKGKVLKKGVPIKQLQKYNKEDDKGNYSNTSSDTENEDQQRKRRRVSPDSESSKSVTPAKQDQPVCNSRETRSAICKTVCNSRETRSAVCKTVCNSRETRSAVCKTVCNSRETRSAVCKTVCNSRETRSAICKTVCNSCETRSAVCKTVCNSEYNK